MAWMIFPLAVAGVNRREAHPPGDTLWPIGDNPLEAA